MILFRTSFEEVSQFSALLQLFFSLKNMTSIRKRLNVPEQEVDDIARSDEKQDGEKYSNEAGADLEDLKLWRHLIPEGILGKLSSIELFLYI